MGGRADLPRVGDRPFHLLVGQDKTAFGPGASRRGARSVAGGVVREELLRVRATQADRRRPPRRYRCRA